MCCKDLWYLEVTKPLYAVKVALVRASTHALELSWTATTFAAGYVLQIQKIEQAQVTATKPSQTTVQQSVATSAVDSNDTESTKSQISVIHLGAQTGVQPAVTGVSKAAIDQTTPSVVQLPNAVKTVVSHAASALTTSTASTVQVQPQISIISSTATGAATGGLLQKLRGNASSNKITTASTVSTAEPTVAVRVTTSVAPSGSIVLNPQTTASTASSTSTTSLRFVPSITSGAAGQTLRLAATYSNSPSNANSSNTSSTSTTTTILKTAQSSVTVQKSGTTTSTAGGGATGTTSTLGGKQYFIQKPLTLAPNVQLQFVKTTSGGMAVQTLPKVNFNLAKGSAAGQAISVCNQQLAQGPTQIQVRQSYLNQN